MPVSEFTGAHHAVDSEAHRHECECRHILDRMATREARNAYLTGGGGARGVRQIRGEAAAEQLRVDVLALALLRADDAGRRQMLAGVAEKEPKVFTARVAARLDECLAARAANQTPAEAGITTKEQQ